ncbi:MAG: aminoglycoside 3'-phosphotransferase [Firmicutes bacterium]|nr:aminoglycoside 3'-phosphotransferase [Bacillota bacterium]
MNYELPKKIKNYLVNHELERVPGGMSGAELHKFIGEGKEYFLKIIDVNNKFSGELEVEYKLLKWLEERFKAPQIIEFKKSENNFFLLMTAIDGVTLEQYLSQSASIEDTVKIYAESLKLIHSIDITGCPNIESDDNMLVEARKNLELGIKQSDLDDEFRDISPIELYNKLVSLKPQSNENVFIHGDYCLDNIIIKENKLNGIVDLGRAGIGDKYKDIALAVRTIKGDFGEEWLEIFFSTYGIVKPDWNKIKFYIIMDEFF